MDKESLKILAMVECMLLWDYLANSGVDSKLKAIDFLFNEGKLSCSSSRYMDGCPFCTYLIDFRNYNICGGCMWPGDKRHATRCCNYGSPFKKWLNAKTKAQIKKASAKVLEMLKQIPMD